MSGSLLSQCDLWQCIVYLHMYRIYRACAYVHKNRFGDGDLGPRGMALFFKTFRHCDLSDRLGIPIFPLSRNERKHQAKYSEDESTLSEGSTAEEEMKCNFRKLDANRQRRKSVLMRPIDIQSDQSSDTDKR